MIQRLQTILGHFQWENGHNSIQQSWITIKNATFDISKKFLGPVHLHPKTDKWDYLRSPIMKKKIVSCFDIGEVPRSPGKWNWNWLYFLPFIFTFEQGVEGLIQWSLVSLEESIQGRKLYKEILYTYLHSDTHVLNIY